MKSCPLASGKYSMRWKMVDFPPPLGLRVEHRRSTQTSDETVKDQYTHTHTHTWPESRRSTQTSDETVKDQSHTPQKKMVNFSKASVFVSCSTFPHPGLHSLSHQKKKRLTSFQCWNLGRPSLLGFYTSPTPRAPPSVQALR